MLSISFIQALEVSLKNFRNTYVKCLIIKNLRALHLRYLRSIITGLN